MLLYQGLLYKIILLEYGLPFERHGDSYCINTRITVCTFMSLLSLDKLRLEKKSIPN